MLLGPVPYLGMLLLIYFLGIIELFRLYARWQAWPSRVMAVSAGLLLPISLTVFRYQWDPLWFIIPVACWVIGFIGSGLAGSAALILLWLALPLTSFYALGWAGRSQVFSPQMPLAVIALVWVNDTFAYVVGSLLGRHKMTPRLSPGKTWEGFAGGLLFTLLGGWFVFRITGQLTAVTWIFFALIIACLGLMGDLFESALKRKMNVKNMGGLLPGHGGVLDRFDSLLFVAPVMWILLILINHFQ